jgi:hypothetical protein
MLELLIGPERRAPAFFDSDAHRRSRGSGMQRR